MSIAELAGNYLAERNGDQALAGERKYVEALIAALLIVAQSDLRTANSGITDVVSQVRGFVEWLEVPKAEFADRSGDGDKFAALIELSRRYQECNKFYLSEVGVNSSTVWRWANNRSRPSRYIGKRVVVEIKALIAKVLWQICWTRGLTPDLPVDLRRPRGQLNLNIEAVGVATNYGSQS